MNRLIQISFALMLAVSTMSALPIEALADDHGNTEESATPISIGSITAGSLEVAGDVDFFEINITTEDTYVIYSRGLTNVDSRLYDSSLTLIESDSNDGESNNFLIIRSLSPDTYYLRIAGAFSNTTGNYALHLEGPEAGTVSDDHGFSWYSATTVSMGNITSGVLDLVGDRDYLKFTVSEPALYVMFSRGSTDTRGILYDSSLTSLGQDFRDGEGENFYIARTLLPGTYYLLILGESSATGNYAVHLEGPGAGTVSDDHGFSWYSGTPISVGTITPGVLNLSDDRDYFEFTVSDFGTYVMFSRGGTNTRGILYDSSLTLVAQDFSDGEGQNFYIVRTLFPGTYYLAIVSESSASGNYALHLEGSGAGTVSDDHGFSWHSATPVLVDSTTRGSLDLTGDLDFFRFAICESSNYDMETLGLTDTYGVLYDANFNVLAQDQGVQIFLISTVLEPGTYYVRVSPGTSNTVGLYQFSIQSTEVVDSSCDLDVDGVHALEDNCLDVPNISQQDTDLDGYGNACDPDLNNSGQVTGADLLLFRQTFGKVAGEDGYNPDADFNENDSVSGADLLIMRQYFGGPPGPSGLVSVVE